MAKTVSETFGGRVAFTVGLYVVMSSSMLVINKVAVTYMPAPAMVLYAQLATSAMAAVALHHLGLVETDALDTEKIKKFYMVAFVFLGTIFANMKTLQYANVETFIVFRSSTPLLISFLDYFFLGRELPNSRSFLSLVFITLGAIGYVLTDKEFAVAAYAWVCVWFIVFAIDVVYIKYIVETVPMTSWGRVYYQNLIALAPLTLIGIGTGELQHVLAGSLVDPSDEKPFIWTMESGVALTASCVCGIGMSYSGFRLRKEVSATSFTVIGILCKLGTLVVNAMIWDKHASMAGTVCLLVCMVSGFFYQQAPTRSILKPGTVEDGSSKVTS
mmetsp:Transcript_30280/g.58210  ORF Transcript_30280/g.58210 Transcript_30280/m.58210 type:complete len:329 (+) Transcript_30280:179-1165(+)